MLLVAACGSSASAQGCRKAGEEFPHRSITVRQALKRRGGIVTVSGALLARDGKPQKLCSGLGPGSPPACREPSLQLVGIRDLSAIDRWSSHGRVQWVESVTWAGRVEGHTLTFELACASQSVQKAFRDRTGETLTLDAFGSNAGVERLDFAGLPAQEPARLRRRFGYFAVSVRVLQRVPDPLRGGRPDAAGIVWRRSGGQWYALKRYGRNVLLGWLAGRSRRVDARWRLLDKVLRGVAS